MSSLLTGKVLAITRKDIFAKEFLELVNLEGGTVLSLPTIDIVPADTKVVEQFIYKINKLKHEYCVFLSSQAVDILFELAMKINRTEQVISALNSRTVVAIGPTTMQNLRNHNIIVKLIPEKYSSEGLIDLFSRISCKGKRIIIPRSAAADEFIEKNLSSLGLVVDELFLYSIRTCGVSNIWNDFSLLLEQNKIDALIFTSRSTVLSFFEIMQKISGNVNLLLKNIKFVIAIGPHTAQALRERGVISFEPREHTLISTFSLVKMLLSGNCATDSLKQRRN
jgi:uroporphyrinogen-III synthase